MINSGLFYIDNGFRIGISKRGRKWASVLYLSGGKVKARKVRSVKLKAPKPLCGTRVYSTRQVAKRLLGATTMGVKREMSKRTKGILQSIIQES